MPRSRTAYLDVFRGVAAVLIVLYHLTTRYDEMIGHVGRYPFNVPWGWMAWSVFFVLTGFLVRPKQERVRDFLWGKFIRLYPGYWASMIVCFAVTSFALREVSVSLTDFFIDLTMFGNYLGRKSVVGVDWTLSVNLIYYAFIVLMMLLERWTKKNWFFPTAVAWSALSCVVQLAPSVLPVSSGLVQTGLKYAGILLASQYSHLFLTGIVLRRLSDERGKRYKWMPWLALVLAEHYLIFRNLWFEVFFAVFLALFVLCIFTQDKNAAVFRYFTPFLWIAGISYPLYLVHEYLGFAMIKAAEGVGWTSEWILVPCLAAAILIAWAIHCWIEIPVARKLKEPPWRKGRSVS